MTEHRFFVWAVVQVGIWESLLDILILLATAMLLGFVAERLKQSAIVGYLVAGTLVGPGALGWVPGQQHIFNIAELGVALLLFTIGLEFSPRQLQRLGRVPLFAGPFQIVVTAMAAAGVGLVAGVSMRESVVIGAMVTLSSTACALRVLRDRAEIDSQYGRVSLGILLVQDAAVVPLVLIVTALAAGGSLFQIVVRMAISLVLAALLLAVFYVVFNWLIPKVLIMPTWRRNRDLPVLLTVCIAGGTAYSAHALQLSPALGAFVAGVLLAVSPFATQIQADIQPLRALLVTLFFAAIGMFGDVAWFVEHVTLVVTVLAAIVAGKLVIVAILTRAAGLPLQFAVAAGFCLAQIGEFAFVLATIARQNITGQPLLSETAFRALVSATILALLITPYLVAAGPRAGSWLERWLRRRRRSEQGAAEPAEPTQSVADADIAHPSSIADGVVIIGFGPAGQRVAEELLAEHRERLTVIDLNIDNVHIAQRYGIETHVGDATQTDVLQHAGLLQARVVVITVPNPSATRSLVHQVRHHAPSATIVARSRYHIYRWELLRAGAHAVVDEEDHVGLRISREVERVLREGRVSESQ